jgi:hypothetical protein
MSAPVITLIGGPTAVIEANGFSLLTDPTFDLPGEYKLPHVTLKKLAGPARTAVQVGDVDVRSPSESGARALMAALTLRAATSRYMQCSRWQCSDGTGSFVAGTPHKLERPARPANAVPTLKQATAISPGRRVR